ncbi:hypothetical protein BaRGS_00026816 [Batillaria attramentaria]|uniref:Uncharacterized protein n=1 Tax=Batillaria attramentaria TaxID=370345 RepID=A0ABD0K4A8_9CAEN
MLQEMGQFAEKPTHTTATMPENLDKNRNMDALPDDNHLAYVTVHLMGRNQYINAVYMSSFRHRRGLLLTQLPLPDTVVDLWRLVDGCGVRTIVSIGSEDEERTVKGYCRYWPQKATDEFITGPYTIKLTSLNITGDHATSYHLSMVSKTDDRPREVELLHYRNWAGEVPGDTSSLLQLVDTVKAKQTDDVTTPIIIQCIDGSACSGLLCALCDVISRVTYDNEVDVYLTAREVQRIRPQAIKTQTQYRYLYKAAQEYIRHIAVYGNADVK